MTMETIAVRQSAPDVAAALDKLAGATPDNIGSVVCAGDSIETESQEGFLRGHGTQATSQELRATQCGIVQRVNKLVSVLALQQRYAAELGDVVVGRVTEVVATRWKLDLQSRQEATLMLSAVNLPGGVQRRRTVEDELNMRSVFEEGDLISAEVQSLYADGSVALQTRSLKYGKLQGGQLISVPSNLIPRQKQHFTDLADTGVKLILGVNGLVWAGLSGSHEPQGPQTAATSTPEQHETIARVANAVRALAALDLSLTPTRISEVYQESLKSGIAIHAMLHQSYQLLAIATEIKQRLHA